MTFNPAIDGKFLLYPPDPDLWVYLVEVGNQEASVVLGVFHHPDIAQLLLDKIHRKFPVLAGDDPEGKRGCWSGIVPCRRAPSEITEAMTREIEWFLPLPHGNGPEED